MIEQVLDFVDRIPAGQVATYGEIGHAVGCSARQVGRIMRDHGHQTNWWRVVRADGTSTVAEKARPHWITDGLPLTEKGVDLRRIPQPEEQ